MTSYCDSAGGIHPGRLRIKKPLPHGEGVRRCSRLRSLRGTFGTAYAAAARAAARAQLRDAPVSDHPHGRAARQQHRARMDTHERRCASAPVYEDLLLATALPCRRRAAELRAARGAHALQCSTFPGRARREAAPALSQQPHRVEPSDLASSRRTRGGEQLDAREPRLDGDGAQL